MREYTSTIIITEDVNMEKYIYDNNDVLWYELQGDYYIPCLTVPAKEERLIRIWGQRYLSHPYQNRYQSPLECILFWT